MKRKQSKLFSKKSAFQVGLLSIFVFVLGFWYFDTKETFLSERSLTSPSSSTAGDTRWEYFLEQLCKNYIELFQKNTDLAEELLSYVEPSYRRLVLKIIILTCLFLLYFVYKKKIAAKRQPVQELQIVLKIYDVREKSKQFQLRKKIITRSKVSGFRRRTKKGFRLFF